MAESALAKDLDRMSRDQLEKLRSDIDKTIVKKEADDRKSAMSAAKEAAEKYGYKIDDLFSGNSQKSGSKAKSAPKYAHPENPEKTWTGRGRQPDWIKAHLENGGSREDLKI